MKEKTSKYNITFKPSVVAILDDMADNWGLSRSAMLATLVMQKHEQMQAMLSVEKAKNLTELAK